MNYVLSFVSKIMISNNSWTFIKITRHFRSMDFCCLLINANYDDCFHFCALVINIPSKHTSPRTNQARPCPSQFQFKPLAAACFRGERSATPLALTLTSLLSLHEPTKKTIVSDHRAHSSSHKWRFSFANSTQTHKKQKPNENCSLSRRLRHHPSC